MRRSLRVAIVEDDPDDYEACRDLIAAERLFEVAVDWYPDAQQAVEGVTAQEYDLLFVDYRLGDGRTGLALTRDLRAMDCGMPIIMVTGHANDATERAALHAGVDFFLAKEQLGAALLSTTLHFAIQRNQANIAMGRLHHPLTQLPGKALFLELLDGIDRMSADDGQELSCIVLEFDLQPENDGEQDAYTAHLAWRDLVLRMNAEFSAGALLGHVFWHCLAIASIGEGDGVSVVKALRRVNKLAGRRLVLAGLPWQVAVRHGIAMRSPGQPGPQLLHAALDDLRSKRDRPEQLGSALHQAATGGNRNYQRRALLVDDNKVNRMMGLKLLDNLGVSADGAENGEEALMMVDHAPYDVIFMDLEMPVMDGFVATERIRQLRLATTPIVALTGREDQDIISQCRAVHMNGYMVKPIRRDSLIRTLDRLFLV